MPSPLEMHSKFGLANWPNSENWLENGHRLTVISNPSLMTSNEGNFPGPCCKNAISQLKGLYGW